MRVALVTGAAGSLGLATARRFALDGLTVVLGDLDVGAVGPLAATLDGPGHRGLALDVSSEASVAAAFDAIERETGPVSVLAHFAGIVGSGGNEVGTSLALASLEDWDRVMAVNARGTFLCVREMARRRGAVPVEHGRIITVSSIAGQIGGGRSGAAYAASKSAVLGLTRTAARDLGGSGLTVNSIAPGPIDTPMLAHAQQSSNVATTMAALVPLGRLGVPEEIAAVASFLASPDSSFVTGATLDVNGGIFIH